MLRVVKKLAVSTLFTVSTIGITLASAIPLIPISTAQASEAASMAIIAADGQRFDLTDTTMADLPQHTLDTHTAWTEGLQHFDGVLLRDVLAKAGLNADNVGDKMLEALALNDYQVDIPAQDAFKYDVLIARKVNGKELSRRDKGPFWIVYPRDQHPELSDLRYDHRWAWQLKQLKIK